MKTSSLSISFRITALAFVLGAFLTASSHAGIGEQPYYGFFPSGLGEHYKKFTHNILGFSIDIPANWTFGVNGTPPLAVVFLYPEGLNTAKFSDTYETIEIGQLPFQSPNLEDAQAAVMRGMNKKHPNTAILSTPRRLKVKGRPAISWRYKWPSKTGYEVTEYITLIESSNGTRSVAVRTTKPNFTSRATFYEGILKTFEPFEPKY